MFAARELRRQRAAEAVDPRGGADGAPTLSIAPARPSDAPARPSDALTLQIAGAGDGVTLSPEEYVELVDPRGGAEAPTLSSEPARPSDALSVAPARPSVAPALSVAPASTAAPVTLSPDWRSTPEKRAVLDRFDDTSSDDDVAGAFSRGKADAVARRVGHASATDALGALSRELGAALPAARAPPVARTSGRA